jgi:hypothetical protein
VDAFAAGFLKGASELPPDIRDLMAQVARQKERKAERQKKLQESKSRWANLARLGLLGGGVVGGVMALKHRGRDELVGKLLAHDIVAAKTPKIIADVARQFGKVAEPTQDLDALRSMLKAKIRSPKQEKRDEAASRFAARGRYVAPLAAAVLGGAAGHELVRGFNVLKEVAKVPGFLRAFRQEAVRRAQAAAAERAGEVVRPTAARVIPQKLLGWAGKVAK